MQPHEADPTSSAQHSPPDSPAPASKPEGTSAAPREIWQTCLIALTTALLAGIASWRVGEATFEYFKPSESASAEPYNFTALNREWAQANSRNGAIAFGALGGLLGLGLGVTGGVSRRSVRGALTGAILGMLLGVAAGALPSFLIVPWQWRHRNDEPPSIELLMPLMIHAGLWCGLGAAAGLAYGLGRGVLKPLLLLQVALGGLVGAALGTVVYDVVGAAGFPMAHPGDPISDTASTRMLARLCVAGFTALGAVLALHPKPSHEAEAVSSSPNSA